MVSRQQRTLGDTSKLPELSESFKQKCCLQEKCKFHEWHEIQPDPFCSNTLGRLHKPWTAFPPRAGRLSFFVHAAVTTTKMSEYVEMVSFWRKSSCLKLHMGSLWHFLNNNARFFNKTLKITFLNPAFLRREGV